MSLGIENVGIRRLMILPAVDFHAGTFSATPHSGLVTANAVTFEGLLSACLNTTSPPFECPNTNRGSSPHPSSTPSMNSSRSST